MNRHSDIYANYRSIDRVYLLEDLKRWERIYRTEIIQYYIRKFDLSTASPNAYVYSDVIVYKHKGDGTLFGLRVSPTCSIVFFYKKENGEGFFSSDISSSIEEYVKRNEVGDNITPLKNMIIFNFCAWTVKLYKDVEDIDEYIDYERGLTL